MYITDNWVSVPTNSVVTIHKQTVMLHPILDEFYSEDLNHDRSSCYAVSKGLVSTAPGTTVPPQNSKDTCAPIQEEIGLERPGIGHPLECAVAP